MNKALSQLAYRNIKKHRKYYIFVCLVTLLLSLFFSAYTIVQRSYFPIQRTLNEAQYGFWYLRGTIEKPEEFDKIAYLYEEDENDQFQYAYVYNQGVDSNGRVVAYATKDFFDLCANQLVYGHLPQNENEIVLSQELFKNNEYHLYQTLTLNLSESEQTEFKIVGVVKNSQKYLFPDIYTGIKDKYNDITLYSDRDLMTDGDIEYYSQTTLYVYRGEQENFNQYGYNHLPIMLKYQELQTDSSLLIESLIITVCSLVAFTSIALKKRSHEFALLRGVGMTTKQLIMMNLYEYCLCIFLSVIVGILASIGVSYGIMRVIEMNTSLYEWIVIPSQLVFNIILIISTMLLALLYPIIKSSRYALSGEFDNQRFQYIQIRYRQLKYQNKLRLAWREMKKNKKVHIFFIIMISFHTSLIFMNQVIDYFNRNIDTINESTTNVIEFEKDRYFTININGFKQYQTIEDLNFEKTLLVKSKSDILSRYENINGLTTTLVTAPFKDIQNLTIKGKVPTNDHEALLIGEDNYCNKYKGNDSMESVQLYVPSEIELNGETISIVGIIEPADMQFYNEKQLENYYLYTKGIYVMPSFFSHVESQFIEQRLQVFYHNNQQRDEYMNKVQKNSKELYNTIIDYGTAECSSNQGTVYPEKILFNLYVIVIIFIVGILLGYVFNKYEMENQQNDYALYQIIGMTKKDLLKKQLCKALIVFVVIECFNLGAVFLECSYLDYWVFPYITFIGMSSFIILICLIVYILPIRTILTNHPIEQLHKIE